MSSLSKNIMEELRQNVQRGEMTPEALMAVARVIDSNIDGWIQAKTDVLTEMVQEWEETMGSDDKSFYSLGIRRAIDVVQEETAYSQLPILEKPNTPDAE
jgi:hypothetical protein